VIGGLENGLVNLINSMPRERYRHAIVCMTDFSDFSSRIQRDDVSIFAMHKKIGRDFSIYPRLYKLFRRIKPEIVHTRNLTALDSLLPALLAGVPHRIHGEHGWDITDPDGKKGKYRWLRRLHRPLVNQYVTLSKHLEQYLHEAVGVPRNKITQIYNGVNTTLFHPASNGRESIGPFCDPRYFVVGAVGRMQAVKDPLTLVRAMITLWQSDTVARDVVRLILVGDGPLRTGVEALLKDSNMTELAWIAGSRNDVADLMRGLDLFVLPSLAEGISNTILEAMASGLPVIATRVGGNPELVEHGVSGKLVPPAHPEVLAGAIREYVMDRQMTRRHGAVARSIAEQRFGLKVMVRNYEDLYDRTLAADRRRSLGRLS
jgi:sugar transferase (PEP-CTERM/EpsH1 system associated)